jgi:hypothetical protein
VPSVAKSDIIHSFSQLQDNGHEGVTIQAPRPTRPNAGPPPATYNPKYFPFSTLSASKFNDNPKQSLHSKTNSTPGTVSRNKLFVVAKVDPLSVPLPITSPPASTVSYSSRSTVSSSSVTSTSPQHSALSGIAPTLNSHDGTGLGMGMTHRRKVSGVGVSGNLNGNALNLNHQINGPNSTRIKSESLQDGAQDGIRFPQTATEETGDSDAGSSLLDDLDLHRVDGDISERRMRAEAKSIRKVMTPATLRSITILTVFTSHRSRTLKSPIGL